MHLESNIVIRRDPEQVWNFLGDITNIAKWDRGVASTTQTSQGPMGVGTEFDTLAYPGASKEDKERGRMSYRVAAADCNHCTVQLTSSTGNALYFKQAKWDFHVEPAPEGSLLICSADFTLRLRYIFLVPILFAMKSAIRRELENLKRVLEQQ